MKEELKKYIELNFEKEKKKEKMVFFSAKCCMDSECCLGDTAAFNNFLENNNNQNKFQTILFKYIDERNLKDSDVYNKVHIDRRLFSKIRSDEEYHPSKETVLLLGLSLELNEKEIEELLDSASYSLPKNNYFDLIMRFCFKNKIYNLTKVNDLLDEYKCKLFNY